MKRPPPALTGFLATALFFLARIPLARADISPIPRDESTPTPFDELLPDVARAFTGTNLLFYGGAIVATGTMAFSGADHGIRVFTQRSLLSPAWGNTAFYSGYMVPAVVAPGIYAIGLIARDRVVAGAGAAALQALGVTLVTTGLLEWGTGRIYPNNGGDPRDPNRLTHSEYAHEFHPFNFNGDNSWPSGHTIATLSIAAALTGYYPEHLWIPFVGYSAALFIGAGMVDRDSHWASDVVAGALIGHAIGYSIGRSFRRRIREGLPTGCVLDSITLRPLPGATYGLAASGTF